MSEDKDKITRGVYYDADDGFGSVNGTYKQSHRILNTITLNGAKDFLNRQKSRQTSISWFQQLCSKRTITRDTSRYRCFHTLC